MIKCANIYAGIDADGFSVTCDCPGWCDLGLCDEMPRPSEDTPCTFRDGSTCELADSRLRALVALRAKLTAEINRTKKAMH